MVRPQTYALTLYAPPALLRIEWEVGTEKGLGESLEGRQQRDRDSRRRQGLSGSSIHMPPPPYLLSWKGAGEPEALREEDMASPVLSCPFPP